MGPLTFKLYLDYHVCVLRSPYMYTSVLGLHFLLHIDLPLFAILICHSYLPRLLQLAFSAWLPSLRMSALLSSRSRVPVSSWPAIQADVLGALVQEGEALYLFIHDFSDTIIVSPSFSLFHTLLTPNLRTPKPPPRHPAVFTLNDLAL